MQHAPLVPNGCHFRRKYLEHVNRIAQKSLGNILRAFVDYRFLSDIVLEYCGITAFVSNTLRGLSP
jgi:hypothetical protein